MNYEERQYKTMNYEVITMKKTKTKKKDKAQSS